MHCDKPTEGIWSLLKRSMANFAAANQADLVRIIKRKLKKIQYRPHLIDGCLAATTGSSSWCYVNGCGDEYVGADLTAG